MSALLYFIFVEEKLSRKRGLLRQEYTTFLRHTKKAALFSYRHKTVFALLLITGILMFSHTLAMLAWVPHLLSFGFVEAHFGYLFSAAMVTGVFGPFLTHRLVKRWQSKPLYLALMLFFSFLSLLFVPIVGALSLLIVLYLLITFFSSDLYHPVYAAFFQDQIPSKMRATLGSFSAMVIGLVAMVANPLGGFFIDFLGSGVTLFIAAVSLLPALVLYLRMKR